MTIIPEVVLEDGKRAFERFSTGLRTGDWEPFLEILTDDFTFTFPAGAFQGVNVGKDRAREFFLYVSSLFEGGLETEVQRITYSGSTVVFELNSQGNLRGQPYTNQVAVSFDLQGDRVCAYREYFSLVYRPDPNKPPS